MLVLTRFWNGASLTEEKRAAVEDRFPVDDWKYEVGNGDTVLGYADWLEHRILGSSDGGEPYFCFDSQGQAVFPGDTVTAMPDCDVGFRVKFTGTVRRFVLGGIRGLLVVVSDQYGELRAADSSALADALIAAVQLLAPLAPHISQELWAAAGQDGFVAAAAWPRRSPGGA